MTIIEPSNRTAFDNMAKAMMEFMNPHKYRFPLYLTGMRTVIRREQIQMRFRLDRLRFALMERGK